MSDIVIVSGSPVEVSRSQSILDYIGNILEGKGISVECISVREVSAGDLMSGNFRSSKVNEITEKLTEADAVVVGSPVYKAAYSGVLKCLFDILPQDVLDNTPVLPIMTGGSISHLLALEYALKPLLSTLKGKPLKGIYYLDSQVDKMAASPIQDENLVNRTKKQLEYLVEQINTGKSFS